MIAAGLPGAAHAQLLDPCPYTNDGDCDEPNGLGYCAWGTDIADCTNPNSNFGSGSGLAGGGQPGGGGGLLNPCPYTNDGDCDEPNGLGYCAWGTDIADCSNPNSNFGTGSGSAGGGQPGGGGGLLNPCPYTNDGDCDEPNGLGYCAWGTDIADCTNPNSNFGSGSGPAGGGQPGGGGLLSPCPYTNDGDCDEPEGLGYCAEGTDVADCTNPNSNFGTGSGYAGGGQPGGGGLLSPCPYTNDGDCDEPNGLGFCAWGTDIADCTNPNSNFGSGSGPAGGGQPGGGGGLYNPCPFTNDGDCDEPEGLGYCAEGTDVADCANPNSNYGSGSGYAGGGQPGGGGGLYNPCPYTNDGDCDEPEGLGYCAEGTDVADCANPNSNYGSGSGYAGGGQPGGGGISQRQNPCPREWLNDGTCHEPNGLGWCEWRTDVIDCANPNAWYGSGSGYIGALYDPCPYTNDGDCDEPNGLGYCAWGTDVVDCSNPNSNYGIGPNAGYVAGTTGGGGPAVTGPPLMNPCPYQNDGICQEPQGTNQCAPGTDRADCQGAGSTPPPPPAPILGHWVFTDGNGTADIAAVGGRGYQISIRNNSTGAVTTIPLLYDPNTNQLSFRFPNGTLFEGTLRNNRVDGLYSNPRNSGRVPWGMTRN